MFDRMFAARPSYRTGQPDRSFRRAARCEIALLGAIALLTVACAQQADTGSEDSGNHANGGTSSSGQISSIASSGGGSATDPIATRGGSSAVGGGATSTEGGATSAEGGTGGQADLAEKGLCAIDIGCSDKIVDTPSVTCTFELRDSEGNTVYSDHAAVQLRGRSSLGFPKKNYAIELHDAAGAENPTNLLGMGKESDWVLDGCWVDRSFMRNRLTYGLFRDTDPVRWAPRVRYCELTLNGTYAGLYALIEKIKRDDDRVVLPDDDGTGSTFLVKQDDAGTLSLSIGSEKKWQVLYPTSSLITNTQVRGVQTWLDQLGAVLSGSNPSDLLNLFDAAAIVDWILVEELAKNVDAYNLSLYFAHPAGGLAWIIPWDTDLAYGQPTISKASSPNENIDGWIYTRTSLITKLEQIPSIRQGLGPRWRELRGGILSDQAVQTRLDGYATILTPEATARNFAIWPITAVDFTQFYAPYTLYKVSSYDDEMTHFRNWIQQRLTWLDANIDNYPSK
jgi:hypothetical protein